MKKTGLRNRFAPKTRMGWMDWYDCMICGRNQIDALHHIHCPSVRSFIDGKHNRSIYNSCPIHNQVCHIGNEAFLYSDETVQELLAKTFYAVTELGWRNTSEDLEYLRVYIDLYPLEVQALIRKKLRMDNSPEETQVDAPVEAPVTEEAAPEAPAEEATASEEE